MTVLEQIRYNSGLELDINEGLRFFKKSKKIKKAILKAEKMAAKYRYAGKEDMNKHINKLISDLKKVQMKLEKIETSFYTGEANKASSKNMIKQLAPEIKRINLYAKNNIGTSVLKKSKLGMILGLVSLAVVGAGVAYDQVVAFDIKDYYSDKSLNKLYSDLEMFSKSKADNPIDIHSKNRFIKGIEGAIDSKLENEFGKATSALERSKNLRSRY